MTYRCNECGNTCGIETTLYGPEWVDYEVTSTCCGVGYTSETPEDTIDRLRSVLSLIRFYAETGSHISHLASEAIR